MPLTQRVSFKAPLRKKSRFQVPSFIRWQFKLETTEALKVTVSVVGALGIRESFLCSIRKDGCITVPHLVVTLLRGDKQTLERYALEVTLEPENPSS